MDKSGRKKSNAGDDSMQVIQRHKLFLMLMLSFILKSCSVDLDPVEIIEMKGYVVAKDADANKILVVPNIDTTVVERIMNGELDDINVAQDNSGINFYISKTTYESVKIGDV